MFPLAHIYGRVCIDQVCISKRIKRRLIIRAACVALLSTAVMPSQLVAENLRQNLELPVAVKRTLKHNPQLLNYEPRFKGLEARALTAKQTPPLALGLSIENFAGSGPLKKLDAAELTLSLSSVIELGGKRNLRSELVGAEAEKLAVLRELETLNVLGDLTQTFINTRGLEGRLRLADNAITLAESTLKIVKRRADAGASPEAEVWRAKAGLNQAALMRADLAGQLENQKLLLAAFWGARSADFENISGELYEFAQADSFEALYHRASAKPLIQIYASEQRIRELDLQAAQAAGKSDIQWQLGLRHLQEGDDSALVAGVSVPLFGGSRNQGALGSSQAALNEVQYQKRSALLSLHTRLRNAYRQREISIQAVQKIRSDLLPALERALTETRKAYEHGLYTYVDWSAAQRELQAGKHLLIDAALSAHLSQAKIEQLSGESLTQIKVSDQVQIPDQVQIQPTINTTAN
ncbi:MAG: TolC family protein [Porticoccaceae bacterium]|nr:TolC family protein [Porticoccaceae bacterium]